MTALLALALSEADFPPLFPPIRTHKCTHSSQIIKTVLYVKHVVVTMIVLRVSLFGH